MLHASDFSTTFRCHGHVMFAFFPEEHKISENLTVFITGNTFSMQTCPARWCEVICQMELWGWPRDIGVRLVNVKNEIQMIQYPEQINFCCALFNFHHFSSAWVFRWNLQVQHATYLGAMYLHCRCIVNLSGKHGPAKYVFLPSSSGKEPCQTDSSWFLGSFQSIQDTLQTKSPFKME